MLWKLHWSGSLVDLIAKNPDVSPSLLWHPLSVNFTNSWSQDAVVVLVAGRCDNWKEKGPFSQHLLTYSYKNQKFILQIPLILIGWNIIHFQVSYLQKRKPPQVTTATTTTTTTNECTVTFRISMWREKTADESNWFCCSSKQLPFQ